MINQLFKEIISNYSNSIHLIKHEQYKVVKDKEISLLQEALGLEKSYLKFIECISCGEENKIQKKNNQIFIHCSNNECNVLRVINDNEILAYQVNLGNVADFVIKLLEINHNKQNIKNDCIIYLGSKIILDIEFNIILLKEAIPSQDITKYCTPKSNKTPTIIVRLHDKNLAIEQSNIADCYFNDLIFYDNNLRRFSLNYKTLINSIKQCFKDTLQTSAIQTYLNKKCLKWFKDLIANDIIKRREKEKYRIIANEYFNVSPNKYKEIWKVEAPEYLKKGGR